MATHSGTLAWKIPWMEEPGRRSPWGCKELDTTERLHFHFSLSCIGEGNGNPLQCSCLENPRDGGAWWAAVYRVAQSRTRLKRLSSSSIMSDSADPWTVACRLLCLWNFSSKNTGVVCHFLLQAMPFPDPRMKPASLTSPELAEGSLPLVTPGKPQ